MAGFECSDHQLEDGRRLDLLASTRHDRLAGPDYARVRQAGMSACRDGVSWVRSERTPGGHDFSSLRPRLQAAAQQRLQVIWDLMHFGWPDHIDVFSTEFPGQFARYALSLARWYANETDECPMFALINEMSFLSWAGGDMGCMNPFAQARGDELKVQFVLATIEAIEAIRDVLPHARFVHPEPVINVVPSPEHPKTWRRVECDNLLQYEAFDMLAGKVWPRLGGHPKYLDILGVNFYPDNQFMIDGSTVVRGDSRYKPLATMLLEVWQRYGRPMIIAETGAEGDQRVPWLRYVAEECESALRQGCELHGVTLYPILDHPGWLDDRYCPNGLWGYADLDGRRAVSEPFAEELARQTTRLTAARAAMLDVAGASR